MSLLRSKTNDLLGWLKLRYRGCFRVANGGTVRKQRRESRKGAAGRGVQARLGRYGIDRERTYACWDALVRSLRFEETRMARYLASGLDERDGRGQEEEKVKKDEGGRPKGGCSPVSST